MSVRMEVEVNDKRVNFLLNQIRLRGGHPPLKRIAVIGVRSIAHNFREGGRPVKWEPLAKGDLETALTRAEKRGLNVGKNMKAAKKPRTDKPLVDSGGLMRSVHAEYLGLTNVKIGTSHPVAAFHQEGTGTHGPKGAPYWIRPKSPGGTMRFVTSSGDIGFSKGHLHPGVHARPFVGWQKEDVDAIQRLLADHLMGMTGGNF